MPITISLFEGLRDTRPKSDIYENLRELAEAWPHDRRDDREGVLWAPAEFAPGGRRRAEDVLRIHLLAIDLDSAGVKRALRPLSLDDVAAAIERVDELGLERWAHTTWSSTPDAWRLRLVVALSRPVEREEWPAFWAAATAALAPSRDDATRDPCRIYYLPSCPVDTPPETLLHDYHEGAPLDVDLVLESRPSDGRAGRANAKVRDDRALDRPASNDAALEPVRAWVRDRLERACGEISRAPFPGPVEPLIHAHAYFLGRCAPHLISLDEISDALRAAHRARTTQPDLVAKNDRKLSESLAKGAAEPWAPASWNDLTDFGHAEQIVERDSNVRLVAGWEAWVGYDGARWSRERGEALAYEEVHKLADDLKREAESAAEGRQKALRTAARGLRSFAGASSVVRALARTPGAIIDASDLDSEETDYLFCARNGVIDLRTGELLEHDRAWAITSIAGVDYDPDGDCPTWERFILELCDGDLELVDYVWRALGWTITGDVVRENLFFLLHGETGRNGKTTLVRALARILGDYARTTRSDLLLTSEHGRHPTELATLHGARLAISSEIPPGSAWNAELLKRLTGGDPINVRRMREDEWTLRPTHSIWIAANHLPSLDALDDALRARVRVIPCTRTFVGREDRELPFALAHEGPAILGWLVRGCLEWQRRGLRPSPRAEQATKDYISANDYFRRFCDETFVALGGYRGGVTRAQVVDAYRAWAGREGAPLLGGRALGAKLRAVYPEIKEGKTELHRLWLGIEMATARRDRSN